MFNMKMVKMIILIFDDIVPNHYLGIKVGGEK